MQKNCLIKSPRWFLHFVESFLCCLTATNPVEPEEIGELKKLIQNYMKEESVSWNLKVSKKSQAKGFFVHQEFQDVEK